MNVWYWIFIIELTVVFIFCLICFQLESQYKVIKKIDRETRIVKHKITRKIHKQALDHYGWFNID